MPGRIHKELVALSVTSQLARIRAVIHDAAMESFFTEREAGRIVLAVDEAVSNIIEHAYSEQAEPGDIRITIYADDESFEVVLTDYGLQFDPHSVQTPDIAEHVREGKRDGLGVFLMRQIMDEVKYAFVPGEKNELRLIKYNTPKSGGSE